MYHYQGTRRLSVSGNKEISVSLSGNKETKCIREQGDQVYHYQGTRRLSVSGNKETKCIREQRDKCIREQGDKCITITIREQGD